MSARTTPLSPPMSCEDRVYDRAGNCLNADCDGGVDSPCRCFQGGPSLHIDYEDGCPVNGWPEPEGLGISPPNEFGIVLYNHPFDPERSILDELNSCPPAVSHWHDRAETGSEWADALRLPAGTEGEQP